MAKSFDEQRREHLATMEDALYKKLFAHDENQPNPEGGFYRQGEYKPYTFSNWLNQINSGKPSEHQILGDYSVPELELRKANNPFVHSKSNRDLNQLLRGLGHSALASGYGESANNNRQFPDEYKRYMNPYEDAVVAQVIKDMRADKQEGLDQISSEFTKAGAHGSKILKPNAESKYDRAMEKMIMGEAAKLRSTGYQQAAQIFNADRLAREQNIASRMQIPFGMQRFERGQLGTLENLNNAMVNDRQAGLNAAHSRYREGYNEPFENIANLHSIFSHGNYKPSNYQDMQGPSNLFQENKKGGTVSLREMAKQVAARGRGGDTELAHINPFEAAMLKAAGGSGSINPDTHLREYSFFTNPSKAIKGLGKKNRLLAETLGLTGALFGGIGGGALGGAAKAALLKQKILPATLKGGIYGYAVPAMAGMAGKALGNESGIGKFLGDYASKNAGNFGSIGTKFLGMEDKPNFINSTFNINPHGQKIAARGGNPFSVLEAGDSGESEGFMSKLMGKDKGYLDYAASFAPAAMQGIAMSQARKDTKAERGDALRREKEEREMLLRQVAHDEAKEAQLFAQNKPLEDERRAYEIAKMQYERERLKPKSEFEKKLLAARAAREEEERERILREGRFLEGLKAIPPIRAYDDGGRVAYFKEGGRVTHNNRYLKFAGGGYVDGSNSGVKDNVRADLPEGAYVLDATTISLLGDGNSKAGAKKIDEFLNSKRMENKTSSDGLFIPSVYENKLKRKMNAGGELAKVAGRIVPAKISNGEYVLSPEDVLLFSRGGSLEEGAKTLDKFRERLKSQKGVKKGGILPIAKPIEMYLR